MYRKFYLFFIVLVIHTSIVIPDDTLFEKYKNGPLKTWQAEEYSDYNGWLESRLLKPSAQYVRQSVIMNGNKITAEVHNFSSISSPGNTITDIVWNGLGYAYEFGPLLGAEVPVLSDKHPDTFIKVDTNGDSSFWVHIISDAIRQTGQELNPDQTVRWGFQPRISNEDGSIEYLNTSSPTMPTNDAKDENFDGKPDTWPDTWYNSNLRRYVWPGALGQGATNADKETFYVMDDRDNAEFEYYPFEADSSRRGLGLEIEGRIYQWVSPLAEDAIFLIYKITNISDKNLEKVVFGMWGDPHIGGPNNWRDDWAFFDKTFNMVFAYDTDGESDIAGVPPGYLGYKFLESPGIGNEIIDGIFYEGDGIDNDNDGMIDESWTDGIDNDNDWDIESDDVGVDGVPNTADFGEKDGIPTAGVAFDITKPGEPNFEFTDIDESDMLGLTGFSNPSLTPAEIYPKDDESLYSQYLRPSAFDTSIVQGDRVFLYSSGRFLLRKNETKRFSIALLMGEDLADLKLNATTVQQIYNSGYQFAKPPAKPQLTAVPGDRKVTLYWDDLAESSYDAISGEVDFEGYVIYRSISHEFSDQQVITDINGSAFLYEPLKTALGGKAKFDLDNEYFGPSKTPYPGRGISYDLGNNTGLYHMFVDSNNVYNGQTYYYTVVSYDHGNDSLGIPPSECSKIITFDPTTNKYTFDNNTAKVIPRSKTAGYESSKILNYDNNFGIMRESGTSTGKFSLKIIDELALEDSNKFYISFSDSTGQKTFSIEDAKMQRKVFTSFYDNWVSTGGHNLNGDSILVTNMNESVIYEQGRDYLLDEVPGRILVLSPDSSSGAQMLDNVPYKIHFTYFPILNNNSLQGELTTPIFDGLKITVKEVPFKLRKDLTGWSSSSHTNLEYNLEQKNNAAKFPADYEITFSSQIIDSSMSVFSFYSVATNFTIWNVSENRRTNFVILQETIKDSVWNPGETVVLLADDNPLEQTWSITFDTSETISNHIYPTNGDVFYLATDKPFSNNDLFSFQTQKSKVNIEKAKTDLEYIRVVPNPYVATNIIEPKNTTNRLSRGYRRLYFDKLPAKCTIRIYTTAGELVKVLDHNSTIDDGKEFWDLLTEDNIEVAYGLYFYHVDAPGIGETTGKFAIIK